MRTSVLAGLTAALTVAAQAQSTLPTISTLGSYFFTSTGSRWMVKGVAYQLSDADPLINTAQCTMDANLMKSLGANAIRVYHVGQGDHSGCMNAFAAAGIYLFVDLDTFSSYIIPQNGGNPTWTTAQYTAFQQTMDEFQSFPNTAGFFIGNEVLTDPTQTEVAAYVKAAVRDMKAYSKSKGYRTIPIGYSHADISSLRPTLQNYLACGGNASEAIDFFGLNTYEWCGSSSFMQSGYQSLTTEVEQYPIPIFMSETGCNTPEPRTFQDQSAIFSSEMTPYWSGAIIYEWIQEDNHYGLVSYDGNTDALNTVPESSVVRSGTPTPVTPDFSNLMTAWATVTPTAFSPSSSGYSPSNPTPSCPAYTNGTWEIAGNVALPTLNEAYNSAVQYSLTVGHLAGQTGSSTTGAAASGSGSASGSAASASSTTKSSAARSVQTVSGGAQAIGALAALGGVFLGFTLWL